MRIVLVIFLGLIFFTPPAFAAAAAPAEIIVVYNSAIRKSSELAENYRTALKIPSRNLIGLKLPSTNELTFDDYAQKLRDPIRRVLLERRLGGVVREIHLIKGVPVSITRELPQPQANGEYLYFQAGLRAYNRMKKAYRYAWAVGNDFSGMPGGNLDNFEPFFEHAPEIHVADNPEVIEQMFISLIYKKQTQTAMLSSDHRRKIADRQILSLALGMSGAQGLENFLKDTNCTSGGEYEKYSKLAARLQEQLRSLNLQPDENEDTITRKLDIIQRLYGLSGVLRESRKYSNPLNGTPPAKTASNRIIKAGVESELASLWRDVSTKKGSKPLGVIRIDPEIRNGVNIAEAPDPSPRSDK